MNDDTAEKSYTIRSSDWWGQICSDTTNINIIMWCYNCVLEHTIFKHESIIQDKCCVSEKWNGERVSP